MFPMTFDGDFELRLLLPADAATMFELVLANRHRLDKWMRWAGRVQTEDDARAYIQLYLDRYNAGTGFHAGLWIADNLAGGIACHSMNRDSNKTEIGYWLGTQYTGQGLVTRACRTVITELFTREKMHRIEIQCVVDNERSRAVAERLGFTFEGVKRESEWITSAYRDHALYSLLEQEWKP